jgi:hypothetical protein
MSPWLTIIAVVALTAVLVYLRFVARRHVAALFRSSAERFMAEGVSTETALRESTRRLVRRAPFNRIQENELAFFVRVLRDLGSPVEVGAWILQQCEIRQDATELRDPQKTAQLAYAADLKFSLGRLILNARTLHQKAGHQYPNITIALLASLSAREGWTFVEEQDEALIFQYGRKSVRVPKQGSGKDAAKLILFEEMAQRSERSKADPGFETIKSAQHKVWENFDRLFDEVFRNAGHLAGEKSV